MNAMWMWNFLSLLKFTKVTGSVLLIYLTDGGIQFRNRLIMHIASVDLQSDYLAALLGEYCSVMLVLKS